MCAWFVKDSVNFSLIGTVMTFLHARVCSSKYVRVANHIRPVFEKSSPGFIMICGTTWLGGQKKVNPAVYMYFNGTGICGGETIIMIIF